MSILEEEPDCRPGSVPVWAVALAFFAIVLTGMVAVPIFRNWIFR